MESTPQTPRHLVVVGGGMVARRVVDALRSRDAAGDWAVTVLAEEPRAPYDRVALTSYFTGRDPEDLALGGQEIWDDPLAIGHLVLTSDNRLLYTDGAFNLYRG